MAKKSKHKGKCVVEEKQREDASDVNAHAFLNDDYSKSAPLKNNAKKDAPAKTASKKQEDLFPSLGSGTGGQQNPGFFVQASKNPTPFYMDLLP